MLRLSSAVVRVAIVACMLAVAACAGGGGGAGGGGSGGGGGGGSGGGGGGGGSTFPAAATAGTNPAPSQLASVTGPNFDPGPYPPNGTIFPLTQSALRATSTALSADTSVMNGGATITINPTNVTLKVPGLGIDTVIIPDGTPVNDNGYSVYLALGTRSYVFGGAWGAETSTQAILSHFIGGYETPASGVPTSGSASYIATESVVAVLMTPSGVYVLDGTANLSATFSDGRVTGSLYDFKNSDTGQHAGGNITVEARITGGTSKITGTTAGSLPNMSNGTGTFRGGFYGPDASELGAVWTLSDGSGAAAVGTLGVPTTTAGGGTPSNQVDAAKYILPKDEWWTGGSQSVAAPAAASTGSNSTPNKLATPGGPTFDGSGPSTSASTAFPLTYTTLKFVPGGVAVDTAANAGGATLTGAHLVVPGAGIDAQVLYGAGEILSPPFAGGPSSEGLWSMMFGLNYVGFGAWLKNAGPSSVIPSNTGYYVFGYETPAGSMPTTGMATYSASEGVVGTVFKPESTGATIGGSVSLTANFGTGTVTGSFTNTYAYANAALTPWNNVSVNASIATGTSRFSGTTNAATGPGAPYALKGSATGHIDGGFYGPDAQNLGAIWTLSDGDRSAFGYVGAKKQ